MSATLNRYSLAREVSSYLYQESLDRGLVGNTNDINIKFECEKHFPDRIIDNEFPEDEMYYIFDCLMDDDVLSLIKQSVDTEIKTPRINVYGHDGWMFGVSCKKTANDNYIIKIRTAYKERNHLNRKRVIETKQIFTVGEND